MSSTNSHRYRRDLLNPVEGGSGGGERGEAGLVEIYD